MFCEEEVLVICNTFIRSYFFLFFLSFFLFFVLFFAWGLCWTKEISSSFSKVTCMKFHDLWKMWLNGADVGYWQIIENIYLKFEDSESNNWKLRHEYFFLSIWDCLVSERTAILAIKQGKIVNMIWCRMIVFHVTYRNKYQYANNYLCAMLAPIFRFCTSVAFCEVINRCLW